MNTKKLLMAATTTAILTSNAYSAGFEKSVFWSGKWAGLAGSASAAVDGAESLYFNPAGLAKGKGNELVINYSPTITKFKGSNTVDNKIDDSDRSIKNIPAFLYKHQLNEKISFGVGTYLGAGSTAKFRNVKFDAFQMTPDVKSEIKLVETSIGAGYKVNNNWSFGASWRISYVTAQVYSVTNLSNAALIATRLEDLNEVNYSSFRVGAQYLADDKQWGLGASYRSKVDFNLKGKANTSTESLVPSSVLASAYNDPSSKYFQLARKKAAADSIKNTDVKIQNSFPQQLVVGGFVNINEKNTVFTEYAWTDYSRNKKFTMTGHALLEQAPIVQNWKNMHNARLAFENRNIENWSLRIGYAFASQVTPDKYARSTFSSPGPGHTIGLGAGTSIMNNRVKIDFAGETSFASGTVENNPNNSATHAGRYSSRSYTLHSGVKYTF